MYRSILRSVTDVSSVKGYHRLFSLFPTEYPISNLPRFVQSSFAPSLRPFSSTSVLWAPPSSDAFRKASEQINALPSVDNTTKLKLYALYKQATVGVNTTSKPGMFDVVGKFKWDAWTALGNLSQTEAEKQYIELVHSVLPTSSAGGTSSSSTSTSSSSSSNHILTTTTNGILKITLNRPDKRNAYTLDMYKELSKLLNDASETSSVNVIILEGSGNFYSSGNDLGNFAANLPKGGPKQLAAEASVLLEQFVNSFIDCKKIIIASVNGPAVGIATTTLPLCDFVYASHKATFHTPFTSLGLSPEACSSITFPRLMGFTKANEMLILGKKVTAEEAKTLNIVTEVFEDASLKERVNAIAKMINELPSASVTASKQMIRSSLDTNLLKSVNKRECTLLQERWISDECMNAVVKFMQSKK